jgi:hypothetical protein
VSVEAAPGFEPGIRALQARALPLGYAASEDSAPRKLLPSPPGEIVAHRMYQQDHRESIECPGPIARRDQNSGHTTRPPPIVTA